MKALACWHSHFVAMLTLLRSFLRLTVSLYWGRQFIPTGWSKMHSGDTTTGLFVSLPEPLQGFNAHFVSRPESFGGLLLGPWCRVIGLILAGNIQIAGWIANHELFTTVFSGSVEFYITGTFMFASVLTLVSGASFFSLDLIVAKLSAKELPV